MHLGDEHKDPDFDVGKKFNVEALLSKKNIAKFFLIVFRPQFYFTYLEFNFFEPRETLWLKSFRIVWLVLLLNLILTLGLKSFALYYALPFLTTYQWMKFFSDMADHAGVIGANLRELRSRNHIFKSKILNFILFPRSDSYHLVHHLFPVIPTWNLREAHSILLENKFYAQLNHGMSKTLKQDNDL